MLPCTAMVISGVPSHTQFRTLPARTDVTGPDAKDRTHNRFVNRIGPHQRPDMDSSGKVHRRRHGDFHPQGTVARARATANGAGDRAPTASLPLDLRLIDLLPRHSSSRHKGGIGAHRPDERSREQPQR